jgi:hypothetical protein
MPYGFVGFLRSRARAETPLVAKLNSLTKTTNSGYLYLTDGTRAFYRYKGDNPQQLHLLFGTYSGLVRIRCIAHLDANLKIVGSTFSIWSGCRVISWLR